MKNYQIMSEKLYGRGVNQYIKSKFSDENIKTQLIRDLDKEDVVTIQDSQFGLDKLYFDREDFIRK